MPDQYTQLPLIVAEKRCTKCGEMKPLSAFYVRKKTGRPNPECKTCNNALARAYQVANAEAVLAKKQEYRAAHRVEACQYAREHRAANLDVMRERARRYRHENIERARQATRDWRAAHPDGWQRAYYARRPDLLERRRIYEDRAVRGVRWCSRCQAEKPLSEFRPATKGRPRLRCWCNQCQCDYALAYHYAHPEEAKEKRQRYYYANREKASMYRRQWRHANRQHGRDSAKRNYTQRLSRMGEVAQTLTVAEWRGIQAYFGHRCAYCLQPMTEVTLDHIVPLAQSGEHTAENVVPCCRSCNSRKKDRSLWAVLMLP